MALIKELHMPRTVKELHHAVHIAFRDLLPDAVLNVDCRDHHGVITVNVGWLDDEFQIIVRPLPSALDPKPLPAWVDGIVDDRDDDDQGDDEQADDDQPEVIPGPGTSDN